MIFHGTTVSVMSQSVNTYLSIFWTKCPMQLIHTTFFCYKIFQTSVLMTGDHVIFSLEFKISESSIFITIALPFSQQMGSSSKRQSDRWTFNVIDVIYFLYTVAIIFFDPLHSGKNGGWFSKFYYFSTRINFSYYKLKVLVGSGEFRSKGMQAKK